VADLVHVGFGTVNGKDGKALKTRNGGTVKLAELLGQAIAKAEERLADSVQAQAMDGDARKTLARKVGIAAIKFADLSSNRISGYVFDLDRLVSFEGKTGPYLQYQVVRITSILSKAAGQDGEPMVSPRAAVERELALECTRFPDILASAERSLMPSEVADYAYGLAQRFSRFYAECQVLGEPDEEIRQTRIALCRVTRDVLSRALWVLGIEVPDQM
jgi:arginyl-tRNA synthetase